jgi:N4-gp56 family major capsid protein
MPIPGGTLNTTTSWTTRVATALDLEVATYLREEPIFRAFTDSRPERQSYPGKVVTKTVRGELALATTPLSESLDVDAVAAPADRQFNVTLAEYGNAMVDTHLLRKTDWSQSAAAEIGMEMGLNATRSIDAVYRAVLDGSTNVIYSIAAGVQATDPVAARTVIKSKDVAFAKALLRRRNAVPRFGNLSACVIHPDVAHDLMAESGTNTWRQPHEQVDTSNLYNRVLGDYAGVRFVENSKCTILDDANADLYTSYFIEKEALFESVGDDVRIVVADPIDALKRFYRVGWYALLGVSRFRENAIQRLRSSSSIAAAGFGGVVDGKA